jgi:transposase IS116/IS110/IS902 family protein
LWRTVAGTPGHRGHLLGTFIPCHAAPSPGLLFDLHVRVRPYGPLDGLIWPEDGFTSIALPQRLPGIGVIGATAIVATVADPTIFRSGRDFAAWIGLVPRQDSTGGKQKLGPISKQGDQYLRRILIVGAIAVLRRALENPGKYPWLTQPLARRPFKVVAVALANKMARTAWALPAHGGTYRAPELAEAA